VVIMEFYAGFVLIKFTLEEKFCVMVCVLLSGCGLSRVLWSGQERIKAIILTLIVFVVEAL
jgi:hypothetical protein